MSSLFLKSVDINSLVNSLIAVIPRQKARKKMPGVIFTKKISEIIKRRIIQKLMMKTIFLLLSRHCFS